MCLVIKSGPHTATKDLYTLKIGEDLSEKGFRTFYQEFPMIYNKLYRAKLTKNEDGNIEKGFHTLQATMLKKNNSWLSYISFDDCYFTHPVAVILCKIPKGSIYYIGDSADIASNQLVPIEPLLVNKGSKVQLEEDYEHINSLYNDLKWVTYLKRVCKSYGIELF